jgi:hypothetical protein
MRTKLELWIIIHKYIDKEFHPYIIDGIVSLKEKNLISSEELDSISIELRNLGSLNISNIYKYNDYKEFIEKRIFFHLERYVINFFGFLYFFILLLGIYLNSETEIDYFFIPGLIILLISFFGIIYSKSLTKIIIKLWKIY